MNVGFVSLKLWFFTVLIIVALTFVTGALLGFGWVWNSNYSKCAPQYHLTFGDPVTIGNIHDVEFKYRPLKRVCNVFEYHAKDGFKDYDPSKL